MISGASPLRFESKEYTIATRYILGSELEHVSDYWESLCVQYGYEVQTQEFGVNSVLARNVVCRKLGTSGSSDHRIVVGAHYDSISQDPMNKAPGMLLCLNLSRPITAFLSCHGLFVNRGCCDNLNDVLTGAVDNGSGAAAVANLLTQAANFKFAATIDFVFFSGEEQGQTPNITWLDVWVARSCLVDGQGLYGSKHYVSELNDPTTEVAAALVMDMIAFTNK
jgi:hypothetical protein